MNRKSQTFKSALKTALMFVLMSYLTSTHTADIEIASLGELQLNFSAAEKTSYIPGQKILSKVTVKDGEAYIVTTPTNVQQLSYLVSNGEILNKGQAFAIIRGPEVHHFLSKLKAVKVLYQLSQQRLNNSSALFEKKLIKEDKWLEINQNYYYTSLEYEHMMHFFDLIASIDRSTDSVTLIAPVTGILTKHISTNANQLNISEGDTLAIIVPQESKRLTLQVPSNQTANLAYLESANCRAKVDSISQVSQGAFVEVWSEPVADICPLILGQSKLMVPWYQQKAYRVAKQAVFSLNGKDLILVKRNELLKVVEVDLLVSEGKSYYFTPSEDIAGVEVLVSSVSAVQGMLIGLGGE